MNHTDHKNPPKIAIIGRPNVGKSTIFNRILGHRKAIVEAMPGVTRDRIYALATINGLDFVLIDTGGIVSKPKQKISQLVYRQSEEAIIESDAVLFVCDAISQLTYEDENIASLIKSHNKKSFLIVNKADTPALRNEVFIFYKLGLGEPYAISATHKEGFKRLTDDIAEYIYGLNRKAEKISQFSVSAKIAIVGRPNVGKSSFVNSILNKERMLVDDMPGTTRDAIDVYLKRDREVFMLIDTAGIRHKKKIKETIEIFSLARAKESIKRCDVCLVMIDGPAGLHREDMAVIDYVIKKGRGCLLAVNKKDLIVNFNADGYKNMLISRFKPFEWIPIIFTSCKTQENIIKAFDIALAVGKKAKTLLPTPQLNNIVQQAQRFKSHPVCAGVRPKIFYATQTETSPAKFLLFVSKPQYIKTEYIRYIENSIRKAVGLEGVPITFECRTKE